MMALTQASDHVQASVSHVSTASQSSMSMVQCEIEFLEEQVLGISKRNTQSPAVVEEMALKDGEMLGKTNEGDQSPAVYIENCSPDLSMNCSITSSNKNSLAHTLSLMSQASQYYSSGEGNSVAFDIRNIISEGKSHLWQHSVEDLLHAEILISLKSGFTAGKTELSSSYMEQRLSEPPSHQRKKRKYEDSKSENDDFMIDSVKSLNNKWKIDAEGTAEEEDSSFVFSDVQKSKSLVLSKAIKSVITDQKEMNAASMEMCPHRRGVCGCAKTRDVYFSANTRSHSSLISYKCRICGKKFADNGTLCLHVKLHKTLRLYKCDVCDKVFQHSFALKLHMKMHKTKDASTARYSNTGRATFDSESSAEESIYECDSKSSAEECIYECDNKSSAEESIYECDSKSSAEESIYECDNKSSAEESIYECDSKSSAEECIYECDSKSSAEESIYECDNKFSAEESIYECDSKSSAEECIYECDNKSSAEESIYECDSKSSDECEVSGKRLQQDGPVKKNHFSSSQYLSISSKTYQNCFGRLRCLSCPKSFSNHHQLQIHAVYHSEPVFKCLMCDKAFYHVYQWQVHQISHTGMPQYVCRICKRSFLFAFSLRMHMRLHTSLRILHRMLQSAQGSNSGAVTARTKNTRQLL